MKVEFSNHDEHQKILDSGTDITDALDAQDIEVEDVRCTDPNCTGDMNQEDDDENEDERSAYRTVNGSLEVRERKQ